MVTGRRIAPKLRPQGITHCQRCGQQLTRVQQDNRQSYCSRGCISPHPPQTMRKCLGCDTEFWPYERNPDRYKYCSMACASKSGVRGRPAKVRICLSCGNGYQIIGGWKHYIYCSNQCLPVVNCLGCQKEIPRGTGRRFCSEECRYQVNYVDRKEVQEKQCAFCAQSFIAEYRDHRRLYCSDLCSRTHHRITWAQTPAGKESRRKDNDRAALKHILVGGTDLDYKELPERYIELGRAIRVLNQVIAESRGLTTYRDIKH